MISNKKYLLSSTQPPTELSENINRKTCVATVVGCVATVVGCAATVVGCVATAFGCVATVVGCVATVVDNVYMF